MKYGIFTEKPEGFYPKVEVAGCYCEWEDKLLFLKRHPKSPQGNTWGIPAGKMEKNETPRMTIIREVREEIGLDVDDENLEEIGCLFCRLQHLDFDFIFHVFRKSFDAFPVINLHENEHTEFLWSTIQDAFKLPLIIGGKESLAYYLKNKGKH